MLNPALPYLVQAGSWALEMSPKYPNIGYVGLLC